MRRSEEQKLEDFARDVNGTLAGKLLRTARTALRQLFSQSRKPAPLPCPRPCAQHCPPSAPTHPSRKPGARSSHRGVSAFSSCPPPSPMIPSQRHRPDRYRNAPAHTAHGNHNGAPVPQIRIVPPPDDHLLVYEEAPTHTRRRGQTMFHAAAVHNRAPLVRDEELMTVPREPEDRPGRWRRGVFASLPELMAFHTRTRGYVVPYVDACQWSAMYPVPGGRVFTAEAQASVARRQALREAKARRQVARRTGARSRTVA